MNRLLISLAALGLASAAAEAAELPKTGSVKHAAYTVCRSAVAVELADVGSDTAADCSGIVRTTDGSALLDNLGLHCLEASTARKSGYKFSGSCVETDGDGDKLLLTYEGPESGPIEAVGGTGKFKGIKGKGQWSVVDAPGNTKSLFAFTLTYSFAWTFE